MSDPSTRLLGQQQPVHTLQAVLEMQTDVKEEWYGEARGKPVLARPASKPDLREEECCHQKQGFWAVWPAVIIRLDWTLCHQRMAKNLWSLPKDFIQGRRKSEPTKQV